MTRFLDGPAAGKSLSLKRAPIYLRAVQDPAGKWDALDQLEDEPKKDERIVIYRLKAEPGWCHIYKRGPGSGFYATGEYEVVEPQPGQEDVRETDRWRDWTSRQPVPEWLKALSRPGIPAPIAAEPGGEETSPKEGR